MFWPDLAIIFMTAMSGVSLGLVISSLVADPKTAANIVPLVLIPQIIMGGALIKYEDMNRNLGLVYTFTRWFHEHPNSRRDEEDGQPTAGAVRLRVCRHALVLRRDGRGPGEAESPDETTGRSAARRSMPSSRGTSHNPGDSKRLDDLKETLAVLSGLEAHNPRELNQYLAIIDRILSGKMSFNRAAFQIANGPITAEQLYVNQKVSDLIANAEMEQNDYRRGGKPNVFFGAQKRYFGETVSVFTFNTAVLIGSSLVLLWLLHWILRRQLEVRRS